jgi:hypothetical protein
MSTDSQGRTLKPITQPYTQAYGDGWARVFGRRKKKPKPAKPRKTK